MKKQVIFLGSFLALATTGYSQLPAANTAWPGPSTGQDVGIGTSAPAAKLDVRTAIAPPGSYTDFVGIRSDIYGTNYMSQGAPFFSMTGVRGKSAAYNYAEGYLTGVYGEATDGTTNIGGDFLATGNSATCGWTQYGVRAIANTGYSSINIGVYGEASNACNQNWAGYFNGDTYATGSYLTSDLKLKDNIKSFANAIDKIKLLRPTTYQFKTKEFKMMNLPEGNQIGLIAQELEKVFPELIQETPENEMISAKGEVTKFPAVKSVNYIALIPVLISGLQEQQKQIEELQARLTASENKTGNATSINQLNSAADGFALDQNIPNPFSQETVINYSLPLQIKNASLIVYDLSGKQLTAFPLEINSKSITITSEKLSAGIYIYSVVADGKIMDSKRMVVADKQ
ncbi:MAG TPA: tail fiber domain-containing protein [Bacteroidia bacterium]|nr:tail fiber domain-containing protein [Bacteroidia bacterium]